MRVGVFKRGTSYILDVIPIFAVLSLLFTLFVGDLLKPDDYDNLMVEYQEINEQYNLIVAPYTERYDNGELTFEEYQDELDNIALYFNLDVREHTVAMVNYMAVTVLYYFFSFTIVYYLYNGFTKGKTLGRKFMKIELSGKVNWWTLFVREVIWKTGYWTMLLFVGGILLDIAMIAFSSKKRAPRDYVSGITVKFEGVDYPF